MPKSNITNDRKIEKLADWLIAGANGKHPISYKECITCHREHGDGKEFMGAKINILGDVSFIQSKWKYMNDSYVTQIKPIDKDNNIFSFSEKNKSISLFV